MAQQCKPLWKICAESAMEAEQQGLAETAEHQYKWSLSLAQNAHPSAHEDLGEAFINLADFYMAQSRYLEARDYYRRALDIYDRVFGRDNLIDAMIFKMLAEISLAQKRHSEARLLQARALDILEQRQAS
jgi:tetratricopeptide (TPR) repeat protein